MPERVIESLIFYYRKRVTASFYTNNAFEVSV